MSKRKLLNDPIKSIRDEKLVSGIVGEITPMLTQDGQQVVSKSYGNPLHTVELTNKATGEITKYWADAGLRGSFKMAKVQPGMLIEIEHTGEKEIEQGTVQTYAIYSLE